MHTITVYPKRNPSLEDIKQFVDSCPEGHWGMESGVSRGVIETEDGRIYLDYDDHYRDYYDRYLDDQQRAALSARLGFSPTIALHVHASHAYRHSRDLARVICESLVGKWGGGWSDGSIVSAHCAQ
jgi:hypothetical protein